jgi:hypothetical protein
MKRAIAVLTCLAAVLPAAAAGASAPPKGTYECSYLTSGRLFGLINVTSKTKYAFNNKKKGRYAMSGRNLKFKSGPMKGVYEHAVVKRLSRTHTPYIQLYDGPEFGHHDTDANCLRRKK